MPSFNHGAIQANLIVEFAKCPQFRVCSELSLELDGALFTPDLSIYRREQLDLRHDRVRATEPPLLVVEILSPTQGYQSVLEKIDAYFQHGVKSCWVVSPPLHTITIFLPEGSQETVTKDTAKDPATGLTAELKTVFS